MVERLVFRASGAESEDIQYLQTQKLGLYRVLGVLWLYRGYIGIMENKMETTIYKGLWGLGFPNIRVCLFGGFIGYIYIYRVL